MKPIPFLITAIGAGLLIGVFCGRQSTGISNADPGSLTSPRNASNESLQRSGPTSRALAAAQEEPHDLKALLRWYFKEKGAGTEAISQLERMNAAGIRNLMINLAAAEIEPVGPGQSLMNSMLEAAARELFRREGETALQWANAPDPAAGRKTILTAMITAAVGDSPELAKPWFDRYLMEFGKHHSFTFTCAATRGATARGAEDLVKLKEIFGNDLQGPVPNGPLPDDFDFRVLVKNFRAGEPAMREAMQYWAARDSDAAWTAVKEYSATDGSQAAMYIGALFAGKAVGGKEKEAIRWILPKLDELPQEFRNHALNSLFADSWNTRAAITDIMEEIPREDDRINVADGLINKGSNSNAALAALRALGNEEAQVKTLLKSVDHVSWNMKSPPDEQTRKTLNYYSNIMDDLQLAPESRGKVDAMLRPKR